jgi:hypothetical protein
MADALDAVKDGVATNESARTMKLPRATLQLVQKTGKPAAAAGKKPRLPPEVEDEIVAMVEERQAMNLAPTKAEIMGAAALAAKACGKPFPGGFPSDKWYRGFRKRHPQLRSRNAVVADESRASLGDIEALSSLARILQPIYDRFGITAARVLNFDESPISQRTTSKNKVPVVVSSNVPVDRVCREQKDSFQGHVSAAVAVGADGSVHCPTLVIDQKTIEDNQLKDVPADVLLAGTGEIAFARLFRVWAVVLTASMIARKRIHRRIVRSLFGQPDRTTARSESAACRADYRQR